MELKWWGDSFACESVSTEMNKIGLSVVERWESLYILYTMKTKNEVEPSYRARTVISVKSQHI